MKTPKLIFSAALLLSALSFVQAQDGEKLFKSNCASCHALGKKLVGPDLVGVTERRKEDWILKWVKSSQSLVKAGDETAIKIYNENNKIPMPDQFINEDEIKSVLGYIKTKGDQLASAATQNVSAGTAAVATAAAVPLVTEPNTTLLTMFSFTEYLLLGLLFLFLIVIWMLSRSIRTLSAQLNEKYNGH